MKTATYHGWYYLTLCLELRRCRFNLTGDKSVNFFSVQDFKSLKSHDKEYLSIVYEIKFEFCDGELGMHVSFNLLFV